MLVREVRGANEYSNGSATVRIAILPQLQALTGRSLRRPGPVDARALDPDLLNPAVTNIEAIMNASNAMDYVLLRFLETEAGLGPDTASPLSGKGGDPVASMVQALVTDTADSLVIQATLMPVIYQSDNMRPVAAVESYNASEHASARALRALPSSKGTGAFLPLASVLPYYAPVLRQLSLIPNSTAARAGYEFVESLTAQLGIQVIPEALALEFVGYPSAFIRQRLGFGVDAAPSRAHFATVYSTASNGMTFKVPPGILRQGYLYTVKLTTYASDGPSLSWRLASTTLQGRGSLQQAADAAGLVLTGETGDTRVPLLDGAAMLLYVNAPPWDGAVQVSNTRPIALSTRVDIRTTGWRDDAQIMVRPVGLQGSTAMARTLAARYPLPPRAVSALALSIAVEPDACSEFTPPSAPSPITNDYLLAFSWGINTFQLSSALGVPLTVMCRRLVGSIGRLQAEQPLNSTGLAPSPAPLRYSIRTKLLVQSTTQGRSLRARYLQAAPPVVYPNGSMSAVSQPDLFVDPDAAARAAVLLSSTSAFIGDAVTTLSEAGGVMQGTIIAGSADTASACGPVNASVIAYAVDDEGGVSVRETIITLLPFLACSAGADGEAKIEPAALASAASSVITNLASGTTQANPQQLIAASSQLAGLISPSSSGDSNSSAALEDVRSQLLDLVSGAIASLASSPDARSADGVVDDNTVGAALGAVSDLAAPASSGSGNVTAAAERAANLMGTIDSLVSLSVPTSADSVPTNMAPLSPNTGTAVLALLGNVITVFVDAPEPQAPERVTGNSTSDTPPMTVVEARHNQLRDTVGKLAAALVRSPAQANADPVELQSPSMNLSVLRVTPDATDPSAGFDVGTGGAAGNAMSVPASVILNLDIGSAALSMTTYAYMPYNATAGNKDPGQYDSASLVDNMYTLLGLARNATSNSRTDRGRRLAGKSGENAFTSTLAAKGLENAPIRGDLEPDRQPATSVSSATVLGLNGTAVRVNTQEGKRRRRELMSMVHSRRQRALADVGIARRVELESDAPADPIRITLATTCAPGDTSCRPGLSRGIKYSLTCPADSSLVLRPAVLSIGSTVNATIELAGTSSNGSVVSFGTATFVGQTEVNYTAAIDPNAPNVPSTEHLEAEDEALPFPILCGRTLGGYGEAAVDPNTGEQLVTVSKPVFIYSVECGAGVGPQNVTCGPGYYDTEITYECPTLANVPTCRFWDEQRRRWSGEGCSVVAVDQQAGTMTCECSHLTDFSGRFAALGKQQESMFALAAMVGDPCIFSYYPWLFIIVGTLAGVIVGMVLIGQVADVLASVKYYTNLLKDEEIIFMRGIALIEDEPFILDRYLEGAAAGCCAASFRCMFPRVQRKQQRAFKSAEQVALNMLPGASSRSTRKPALTAEDKHFYSSRGLSAQRQAIKSLIAQGHSAKKSAASVAEPSAAPDVSSSQSEKQASRVLALQDLITSLAKTAKKVTNPDKYGATMYVTLVENYDRLRVAHDKFGDAIVVPDDEEEPNVFIPPCMVRCAQIWSAVVGFIFDGCRLFKAADEQLERKKKDGKTSDSFTAANPMFAIRAAAAASSGSGAAPQESSAASTTNVAFKFTTVAKAAVLQAKLADRNLGTADTAASGTDAGRDTGSVPTADFVANLGLMEQSVAKAADNLATYSWSCLRCWRLRFFVVRMWSLKVLYTHPFLSVLAKFDPKAPRAARLLEFAVGVVTSLWATTFLYAFKEVGGKDGWSFEAAIVTALLASLIQLPIVKTAAWLLDASSWREYEWRYASLTREITLRHKSASQILHATVDQLEQRVKRLSDLQVELGLRRADVPLPKPERPDVALQTAETLKKEKKSASVLDQELIAKNLAELTEEEVMEHAEMYGWRNPPGSCVRWWTPLVRACGRLPSQKRAWVVSKLKVEQEAAKKREFKRERKRAKRAQRLAASQAAAAPSAGNDHSTDGTPGEAEQTPPPPKESKLVAAGKSMRNMVGALGTGVMATATALGAGAGPVQELQVDAGDENNIDDEEEGDSDALNDLLEEIATSGEFGEVLAAFSLYVINHVILATIVGLVTFLQVRIVEKIADKCCSRRADTPQAVSMPSEQKERELLHPIVAKIRAAIAEGAKLKRSAGNVVDDEEQEKPDISRRLGCPCGNLALIMYSFILAWTTWNLFYIFLFGVWQTQEVVQDVLVDFAFSQIVSLCIFYPGIALIGTIWGFVILPSWLPYLVWMPFIGRMLLGKHGAIASADPNAAMAPSVLTGRLQNLTLVRAAGAASMLSPDSAIIAYGVTAAVTGIFNGLTSRKKKTSQAQQVQQQAEDAASVEVAQYKQDLAVLSYTLERVLVAHSRRLHKQSKCIRPVLGEGVPGADGAHGKVNHGAADAEQGTIPSTTLVVLPADTPKEA